MNAVFKILREEYGIERQENLKLRDFPTLQHVVPFLYDNRPDLEPKNAPAPSPPALTAMFSFQTTWNVPV